MNNAKTINKGDHVFFKSKILSVSLSLLLASTGIAATKVKASKFGAYNEKQVLACRVFVEKNASECSDGLCDENERTSEKIQVGGRSWAGLGKENDPENPGKQRLHALIPFHNVLADNYDSTISAEFIINASKDGEMRSVGELTLTGYNVSPSKIGYRKSKIASIAMQAPAPTNLSGENLRPTTLYFKTQSGRFVSLDCEIGPDPRE